MEELFNDGTTIVTTSTLKHRAQSYPIRTITKVSDFKMPLEIKNFAINAGLGVLGLVGIFTFKTIWVVLGLIALGVGGWNVYDISTRSHYMVIVEFSNSEQLEFDFRKVETAIQLRDAINKAISLN
jgi:hypothetical protein